MRILGIDPGFNILGWAVIETPCSILEYGAIITPKDIPFAERLHRIYTELNAILDQYNPDTAAIEKIFFQKNTKSAMDVAKVSGIIILALRSKNIHFNEYTPPQVKLAITGYGKATKEQMQKMMKHLFNIKTIPTPDDIADALAIALCHSCSTNSLKQ